MHGIAHVTFFDKCLLRMAVINVGRFADTFYKRMLVCIDHALPRNKANEQQPRIQNI